MRIKDRKTAGWVLQRNHPSMIREKFAVTSLGGVTHWVDIDEIPSIVNHVQDPTNNATVQEIVPVGTVEFCTAYMQELGWQIPHPPGFHGLEEFTGRNIREGLLHEAKYDEFVKPSQTTKLFTGGILSDVLEKVPNVNMATPVWISEPVQFTYEYRFYVQDLIPEPKIVGWSRYDEIEDENPPEGAVCFALSIANHLNREFCAPGGYSIDVGYIPEQGKYRLVEINDGWALGMYTSGDFAVRDPDYAQLLRQRWHQLAFCNFETNQG